MQQRRILSRLLREIREERGLTQQEIAQRLQVHQTYVSKYELGERRLDLIEIRAVCIALGISLSRLFTRFESAVKTLE